MTKYSGKIENFQAINKRCPNCYSLKHTRFEEKGVVRRRCIMCGAIYGEPEYCYTICKEKKK